jgi:hypothetical protein
MLVTLTAPCARTTVTATLPVAAVPSASASLVQGQAACIAGANRLGDRGDRLIDGNEHVDARGVERGEGAPAESLTDNRIHVERFQALDGVTGAVTVVKLGVRNDLEVTAVDVHHPEQRRASEVACDLGFQSPVRLERYADLHLGLQS